MPLAPQAVALELRRARASGLAAACASAERAARLPAGVLLAVGSRETGCRDVVGDGGHGRGVFQIDDRWHAEWLARHGAGAPGTVPPVAAAAAYAAGLLAGNLEFARLHGVPEPDRLRFALSAYNAGPAAALSGYERGDSDLETTGRDYGRDVLARREALLALLAERPQLRPGSRGPVVLELKRALLIWAEWHQAPRFATGSGYGKAAAAAVRAFQQEAGLEADGVVGAQTWAALDAVRQAAAPDLRPALPAAVSFPADAYPASSGWLGLLPWIAPQVRAVCDRFGLRASAGWGGHPPRAVRSDHHWGGACDLAGEKEAMVACNLWADDLHADPWRPGAVFRWVGGPAADSDGPEPGHLDHVHLSWFRAGPATTVFGTLGFS